MAQHGGALVEELGPQLREEVALLGVHDRHHVALPVLQAARVALDEAEQVLLGLAREARPQRGALLRHAAAVGLDLVGEERVVRAGAVLGLGRGRGADELRLRLVDGHRVAGVQEVLHPLAAVRAHVVGDPLGGGEHARHDRPVDRAQPAVVLEHPAVPEAVGDDQRLGDEAVALHQVGVDRAGVEDELVDAALAALVAAVLRVELRAPARAGVARGQAVGRGEVDLLGADEVVDDVGHVEAELVGGDRAAAGVDLLQVLERVAGHRTTSSTPSRAKKRFSAGHSARSSAAAAKTKPGRPAISFS